MRSILWYLGLLVATGGALAQSFPAKPIKIIVPTSPGGLNDLISRTLGQSISESVGQPVVVENRPGAGSMIGMLALAKSPADGYTIAITTAEPLVYNPLLYTKMPYDAEKDFSYISQLVRTLGAIIAPASAPFGTFPEMIALAKAKPGSLNWATWGPGSTPAMYLEWIKRQNGVDIVAVPYKGAGPSLPATVSGEVQLTYTGIGLALPLIRTGKLKALAITGADVAPPIPDVAPLGKFNSDPGLASGFAAYGPANIPGAIMERLSAELRIALRAPGAVKAMENNMVPVGNTPAEFAAQIKGDRVNAARVLKAMGIKATDAPDK